MEPVPDHSTFARFQDERLTSVIEDLFYQLIGKLSELGEISYENIFVDGTKIEANANRYTFVWAKAVQKNLNKLETRISEELPGNCVKIRSEPQRGIRASHSAFNWICRYVGKRVCKRQGAS